MAMACVTAFALWRAGILAELRWRDMGISAVMALGFGLAILLISRLFSRKPARSPSRAGLFVKNGILTVQFALFFWIFVQIAGYYVNMNGDSWIQTCKGDWSYFTLTLNDAESSFDGAIQAEEDPLFHVHAQAALGRLRETDDFTYMAYTKEMVNRMDEDTLREHFGDEDYEPFLQNSQYGFESIPAMKPHMEEIDGVRQIAMSFASMDQNAVEHYNLKAQAGRLFEADEFRAAKDQREFPVLLGAAYAPYFSVGEKFPFYTAYGTRCTARVVGILEKDMRIITEMTNEDDGYPTVLDYDIVLPFLAFEKLPEAEEMRSFALENDTRSLLGILAVAGEVGSVQSVEVQKKVNDIYRGESLFTVIANNATTGVWLFQSETRESVAILTALMLVALGFQLFSLCAGLISKIERRMYRYSIQLLNGGTVGRIFRGYFLEIAGITLAGLGIALSLQRNMVLVHTRYLLATGAAWLILFALSCGVIGGRLAKIDMEEIMRRKES